MVTDVAVVGGGPAGAATAIALGQRGVRVALYERSRTPQLKACGEGLLPHGVDALRALVGELPDAPQVRGLRFVIQGNAVEADFPAGHGLVVRRDRFDAWLLDRAAATPNVDVRRGTPFRQDDATMVVGADGKRSMFHRRLPAHPTGRQRVGLSTHMAGIDGSGDRVEVFFHDGCEIYIAPSGPDESLVSALFHRSTFRRDGIRHLLSTIPELRARSRRARQVTPLLACSPLGLRVPRITAPGLLLVGDAAGAPDPITGDGIALALTSAAPAADAIVTGNLGAYATTRSRMGETADRLASLLLRISTVRGSLASVLLRRPALISTLVEVAIARRPMDISTLLRAIR